MEKLLRRQELVIAEAFVRWIARISSSEKTRLSCLNHWFSPFSFCYKLHSTVVSPERSKGTKETKYRSPSTEARMGTTQNL